MTVCPRSCEVKYCRRILDGVEHWGKKIRKQDREGLLLKCRDKAPLIARVEEGVGWRPNPCTPSQDINYM